MGRLHLTSDLPALATTLVALLVDPGVYTCEWRLQPPPPAASLGRASWQRRPAVCWHRVCSQAGPGLATDRLTWRLYRRRLCLPPSAGKMPYNLLQEKLRQLVLSPTTMLTQHATERGFQQDSFEHCMVGGWVGGWVGVRGGGVGGCGVWGGCGGWGGGVGGQAGGRAAGWGPCRGSETKNRHCWSSQPSKLLLSSLPCPALPCPALPSPLPHPQVYFALYQSIVVMLGLSPEERSTPSMHRRIMADCYEVVAALKEQVSSGCACLQRA